VSDVAQGPGWWQASDGKWYSPERHPNRQPPAPAPPVQTAPPGFWRASDGQWYPGQPQPYPRSPVAARPPPTNGMAIASFILSLVWIGGLGSLLAVIFGATSRRAIAASQGRQGGEGLALAGLIVGIVGLVGSVLLYLSLIAINDGVNQLNHQIQSAEAPTNVPMGTTVATGDPESTGIVKVTVESLARPSVAGPDGVAPDTGKGYAAAKVEICTGSERSQRGISDSNFTLGFQGGQIAVGGVPAAAQDIGSVGALAAHSCTSGYVSFQIAPGTQPSYVAYQPGLIHQYRWLVPTQDD
jgi:hypothetical protein